MGVVKRIAGWRESRWPIPGPLQVLVGLVAPRDPEAYLEQKRAAREAARERAAIQAERPTELARVTAIIPPKTIKQPHAEIDKALAASFAHTAAAIEAAGVEIEAAHGLPVRAAAGWYRVGSTFYRVGQGPFAGWSLESPLQPPATHQGRLF